MQFKEYTLAELCELTGYAPRTVRYYIQLGLVARPQGEGRAARYNEVHFQQLVQIKRLSEAGVSLQRIGEVLLSKGAARHGSPRTAGSVELRKHIYIAPGMTLQIAPGHLTLTAKQTREFTRRLIQLAAFMAKNNED